MSFYDQLADNYHLIFEDWQAGVLGPILDCTSGIGTQGRDYDRLIQDKPLVQSPVFHSDEGRRRIVYMIWDWLDAPRRTLHLHITRETVDGWEARWIYPTESGFHQPLLLATAGDNRR